MGRQDPNVSRYFDLPWMSYDSHGKLVEGRLATDRPHALKLFGSYTIKSRLGETSIGSSFVAMSGTPLTTEINVIARSPVYVNGRGDMGRTPFFSETGLLLSHEFWLAGDGARRIRCDLNISNLFNQSAVTNKAVNLLHPNYGEKLSIEPETDFFKGFDYRKMLAAGYANGSLTPNPSYGWASNFQGPRYIRLGFKFLF